MEIRFLQKRLIRKFEVCPDDVTAVIAHIPLAKHTRGYVNGNNVSAAGIDVLHQGGVTTLERRAQPVTEQAIDHHVVLVECRRVKGLDHLDEVDVIAHGSEQAVTVSETAR